MSSIVIYDIVSKRIKRVVLCPLDMVDLQEQEGEATCQGTANLLTDYISQGEVTPRQIQLTTLDKTTLTADSLDQITITNAPSGTFTATNTATKETVTGPIVGTDTFSTTIPGTYKIKIESWPYLDFEATVNAL